MTALGNLDKLMSEHESYVICNQCHGTGIEPESRQSAKWMITICEKCQGDGIVDWVHNITGKPPISLSSSTSSQSSYSTPTERAVKEYIGRRENEFNNNTRNRTLQRFYKMSNEPQGHLQRCRHSRRNY